MIISTSSHGFYDRLHQLAAADRQHYTAHSFVQQLAEGIPAENAFRRHLTQDYLFPVHLVRNYALLVSKLRMLPEMRAATTPMNTILNELPLHISYCAQWGVSEQEMVTQSETPGTVNYTRCVPDIGYSGDALDLLVMPMPYVAGYAEIGLGLLQHPVIRSGDNPYASQICNYGGEGHLYGVNVVLVLLETMQQRYESEARITKLSGIFTIVIRLEAQFWQMGLNTTTGTRA